MKLSILTLLLITASVSLYSKDYPKREMRGVWIATVENIDWPSNPLLSTAEQKAEMIALLDSVKAYNMNTIVFQIRPDADALYASELEPWSEWLTGKQGIAPDPWYDPLKFTIDECRKRGLDIHVWLNPYRAIQNIDKTKAADSHVSKTHPDWMLTYGKQKLFDPGNPEVRNHVARVVSDLVRRYDLDAIHFDDYFYPYKITGVEFPDDNSFKKYPRNFGPQDKENWRRDNVNLIIKQIHDSIKSIKPYVEFGISPFGVWRNKKNDPDGSETRAGVTNYDDLYADILKWQKEKWIDYVTPQLYWYIGKEVADYAILAKWWASHSYGCNVYIGQAPFLLNAQSRDQSWRTADEITKQLDLNRSIPEIKGSIHFSAKFMKKDPLGIQEKLLAGHYRYPALTPVNPLVVPVVPASPGKAVLSKQKKDVVLTWEKQTNNSLFVVYRVNKLLPLWLVGIANPNQQDANKRVQRALSRICDAAHILSVSSYQKLLLSAAPGYHPSRYKYVVTALSPSHTESNAIKFKKK